MLLSSLQVYIATPYITTLTHFCLYQTRQAMYV